MISTAHIGTTFVAWQDIPPTPPGQTALSAARAAVADLLQYIFRERIAVEHDAHGAPLPIRGRNISISHSRHTAAVAVDSTRHIGIDIEAPRRQLLTVAPRFLTADELDAFGNDLDALLRAWTVKEAVFKAAGEPYADMRDNIRILPQAAFVHGDGRIDSFEVTFIPIDDQLLTLVAKQ